MIQNLFLVEGFDGICHGIVIGFLHSNGMIIVTHGIVGYNMENRDKNYLVESSHGNFCCVLSKEKFII